jgi:hypothetical protein
MCNGTPNSAHAAALRRALIAEKNFGDAMVESTLRNEDRYD